MRDTLRALSALLGYPSVELQENIAAVREALVAEAMLSAEAFDCLEPLLSAFEKTEIISLQESYSSLFDSSRSLSLHLFEHVHGDNRERGQAMVDLGQQYIDAGLIMEAAELPDFVPLFLEFLSCLPADTARKYLAEPAHVLAVLEKRLTERGSVYAGIFKVLVTLPLVKLDQAAVDAIGDHPDPVDTASLDAAWEDAPINFGAPAQDGGGPTGIIARIRAARRPVGQADGGQHA